jgi:tripartite-type tricarboxylate transporter receptor subunit TctC
MVNIPYRGTAPAIAALLGGQVQGSFIAYAKANPGKIDMATNGNGSMLR